MEKTNFNEPISIDLGAKFWVMFLCVFAIVAGLMFFLWEYNSNRQYRKYFTAKESMESSEHIDDLKSEIIKYYELNKQLDTVYKSRNSAFSIEESNRLSQTANQLEGSIKASKLNIETLKDRVTQSAKDNGSNVDYASVYIYNGETYCYIDTSTYSAVSMDSRCIVGEALDRSNPSEQDALNALYKNSPLGDKEIYDLLNEDDPYRINGIADLKEISIKDTQEIEKIYISFSMSKG